MDRTRYEKGMKLRRKVLGQAHINRRQKSKDPITKAHQALGTAFAWGTIWSRPGLPLRVRSLVTLAMLTALGREDELRGHIAGALNNGATPEEIVEVFVQAAVYCGFPASNTAMRLCVDVFKEQGVLPKSAHASPRRPGPQSGNRSSRTTPAR